MNDPISKDQISQNDPDAADQPAEKSQALNSDAIGQNATTISRSAFVGRIGICLILLSGVFFFSMFAVPWLPMGTGAKVFLGGALFAGVQIAWWVGAAMAGPATVGMIKSWFSRKEKTKT